MGEEHGIILSPEASLEGAKSRAYIGGGFESLFRDGKLGLILSAKAYIEGERLEQPHRREKVRNILSPKAYLEGESSEVPKYL